MWDESKFFADYKKNMDAIQPRQEFVEKMATMTKEGDGGCVSFSKKNQVRVWIPVAAAACIACVVGLSMFLQNGGTEILPQQQMQAGVNNDNTSGMQQFSADDDIDTGAVADGETVVYKVQQSGGKKLIGQPILSLSEDGTFTISYDVSSSYLQMGHYEISADILKAETEDGLYHYSFRILNEGTLSFMAEESSDFMETENSVIIEDGTIFVAEN